MAKKIIDEAANRLFKNMYICIKCNAKMRTTRMKVIAGKTKCRKCGSKKLRLKAKEKRGQTK